MKNLARLACLAIVFLSACTTRERAAATNSDRPAASLAGTSTPPVASIGSPTPATSVLQSSDESLIREYQEMAREPATRTELEAFVATHPKLLTARAHPYGPALNWALEFGEEDAALVLHDAGATTPLTALALAARGGLDAFLDAMLANGADPNSVDDRGNRPLHMAAKNGHASTTRKLLAAKAIPSPRRTNDGFTPLHLAVMERHDEVIAALIAAKADLEAKDDHGRTPLHWAPFAYAPQPKHIYRRAGEPHDTVFVDPGPATGMGLLLDAGAQVDAVDDEGDTPLHEAASLGSVRGAELLLARGAKVNVKNMAGETPLSIAQEREHRHGVRDLLKRGR